MSLVGIVAIALAAAAVAAGLGFALWRRRADETAALRAQAEALRALTETAPGGYYYWDAVDGSERASAGLAKTLGAEDAAVAAFADLAPCIAEADYTRLTSMIGALRGQGTAFAARLSSADGRRDLAAAGHAVSDSAGRALGFIVWLNDVAAPGADTAGASERMVYAGRDKLAEVLGALPVPVWRRNEALDIVWWNAAFDAAVGGKAGVAGGHDRHEFSSLPLAGRARALAESAHAANDARREVRALVIDGERRSFEVVERPAEGGMIGLARDITESNQARGELERHIAAHATVLEQLGTPVAIWGQDRRLKFYNRAFTELFRFDESRLAAEPLHEVVLEWLREDRMVPEQVDFQAYKRRFMDMYTTLIEPVEELVHLPDGRTLRVGRSPHPLGGLLFFYEDVSDQLELERSRNTLAAVQQATLDNLTQAVAVFGSDGRLKLYNRTYADLWGFSDEFLVGEPHLSVIQERTLDLVPILDDGVARDIEAMVERSLDRTARIARYERRDGVVLDSASVPLPDGATLVTFYDVTDSTRVERALRERTEALEETDRLKSQFIANVSYELRTPLNTISGFSEILIDQFFGELNARQLEYVEGILESSGYLLALIDDILDLATIEAGRMQIDAEAFDIPAMAQGVMRLVEERTTEKKLTMRMEVPPDIGAMEADQRRIRQVIFNLLNNAIRFTGPGGTISLGASRGDGAIAIWVADTGQGIAQKDIAGVFDPFRRSGETGVEQPGSGLGLALVERFVELHGGTVELVSEPGKGTRATCVFPERKSARKRLAEA